MGLSGTAVRGTARRFMGEACDCTVCSELFVLLSEGGERNGTSPCMDRP